MDRNAFWAEIAAARQNNPDAQAIADAFTLATRRSGKSPAKRWRRAVATSLPSPSASWPPDRIQGYDWTDEDVARLFPAIAARWPRARG